MSKWRPSEECLYVIPDIHGQYKALKNILSRILPLRSTGGVVDKIVFLGDYIDRREGSHLVLDELISLKEEYGDQIVLLKGNHEEMLIEGIAPSLDSSQYLFWMKNGGLETLVGYLKRSGNDLKEELSNPYLVARERLRDYIPNSHKDFIKSLDLYHETDDFIFVHAGCEPLLALEHQDKDILLFDRTLAQGVINGKIKPFWDKCIVTGHRSMETPYINEMFMSLDCSGFDKLIVLEINSMECFYGRDNKKRLVKVDIDNLIS